MESIITERFPVQSPIEQEELREYVVPFTPEDEELVHNLQVLQDASSSGESRVLDGVRIGKESYHILPTEAYTISSDGRKVFVTGEPGSPNRMAFYAYPNPPQEPLKGIEASPYLRVYKVEVLMTRKTAKKDVELDWGRTPNFTHSYPELNMDVMFVDWALLDIPDTYYLNPLGKRDTVRWQEDHLRFVEYGDSPVVAIGRRNREKSYGDRNTYIRLLRSIERYSGPYGGLQPKEAYLQLAFTEEEAEYESKLIISI